MPHTAKVLLYWAPRVLCIAFAVFVSIFATDVFDEKTGFWHTMLALALHLIPAIIVILILIIAWRWEWIGAVLFGAAAVWYAATAREHLDWTLIIAGPLFLVAALFLADWFVRRQLHPRH
jgi:hypothetical protein